eukprot:CAMPEP_0177659806 /NCGR_PEP_ID=MMETSP0447-20121125/17650_1 /TAXON_ID=0 /ORGANISM="Stygamoeba regulata, Strain BSH-02190019" /LENGTH=230 /DNA_ID=CAMNT_0019164723 /DNA_START=49 /DNA_END=741 /DNA_ORIENTATION=+
MTFTLNEYNHLAALTAGGASLLVLFEAKKADDVGGALPSALTLLPQRRPADSNPQPEWVVCITSYAPSSSDTWTAKYTFEDFPYEMKAGEKDPGKFFRNEIILGCKNSRIGAKQTDDGLQVSVRSNTGAIKCKNLLLRKGTEENKAFMIDATCAVVSKYTEVCNKLKQTELDLKRAMETVDEKNLQLDSRDGSKKKKPVNKRPAYNQLLHPHAPKRKKATGAKIVSDDEE